MKQRNTFKFYRSFRDAADKLEDAKQLALYKAVVNYALDRQEPTFTDQALQMVWELIKMRLDYGWQMFEQYNQQGGASYEK